MGSGDTPSVNTHATKAQPSRLVDEAAAGREVIVPRPMRLEARPARRVLGRLAGRLQIPDDYDAPLPDEVLAASEGG